MRARQVAVIGCLLTALSLGAAACGSSKGNKSGADASGANSTGGTTLTIYSSLPLLGDSRLQSESIVNGERLALAERGGRVGGFTIKYVNLDDSSSRAGKWDPGTTSSDARQAAQDRSTIAYLGELDSGASAISIPILNEANILQVSPASTAVGLTRSQGADKGEPDKYYPSGKRTFGRIVPVDSIQAAAQVSYQIDSGCTKTYVLNDQDVYGRSLAGQVVASAKAQGLTLLGNDGIDPRAADYQAPAQAIKAKGADCVFFSGTTDDNAVQLFKDLNAAMPTVKLFGPDGVAGSSFSTKLGSRLEKMVYVTSPTLSPRLYPKSGQQFFAKYKAAYGSAPELYGIYGYEAMAVVLQAIKDAGPKGNDRQAVIDAFFRIKKRRSVLGTYSIDANGDTTLTNYAAYRIKGGKLVIDKVIRPATT